MLTSLPLLIYVRKNSDRKTQRFARSGMSAEKMLDTRGENPLNAFSLSLKLSRRRIELICRILDKLLTRFLHKQIKHQIII
jgi:hypothetical protein